MLMAPDNGMIDCSLGDDGVPTNGDTCTVTCNEGFRLRGDATRRYRARQMRWLGDEARCIPGVDEMYNFLHCPFDFFIFSSLHVEYYLSLLLALTTLA